MTAGDLLTLLQKLPPDTIIETGSKSRPVPVSLTRICSDRDDGSLHLWLGAVSRLRVVGVAN
jgi:hypothetical protein